MVKMKRKLRLKLIQLMETAHQQTAAEGGNSKTKNRKMTQAERHSHKIDMSVRQMYAEGQEDISRGGGGGHGLRYFRSFYRHSPLCC